MSIDLDEDERRLFHFLNRYLAEAKLVGGSEGLYQSLFYSHARRYYHAHNIHREFRVESGFIDVVIETGSSRYAFELKGGAQGHRNSLHKMKEEEGRGKGLAHDLKKLSEYRALNEGISVRSLLLCIDIEALGIAFTQEDINNYARMALGSNNELIYFSQKEDHYRLYRAEQALRIKLPRVEKRTSHPSIHKIMAAPEFWGRYFEQTNKSPGLECHHVGIFYHELRRLGLNVNQCAPEIFFNCSKYNVRNYHRPDLAIFENGCTGQFQLFGNSKKTIENDQFKLPYLTALLEFKGGTAFENLGKTAKIKGISQDLEKLVHVLPPLIDAATDALGAGEKPQPCKYIMVVTDPAPELSDYIESQKLELHNSVQIEWIGSYF